MVSDIITESLAVGGAQVRMSTAAAEAVIELRDWLYENVYRVPTVHDDFEKASRILRELFAFFVERPGVLAENGGRRRPGEALEISVADFIAGMTDRFAMNLYQRLFLPQPWKIF